jgi:hypothetical protein
MVDDSYEHVEKKRWNWLGLALVFGGLWALMLRYPKTSIGVMVLTVLGFLFWNALHA